MHKAVVEALRALAPGLTPGPSFSLNGAKVQRWQSARVPECPNGEKFISSHGILISDEGYRGSCFSKDLSF